MRTSSFVLSLLLAGCSVADSVDALRSELDGAVATQRMAAMETDMVAAHAGPLPADPLAFAEDLDAFIDSQAACSTVTEDGDTVTVDFGEVDDGCTYLGHTYGGVMVATITEGEGTLTANLQLDGLTDGFATLTGEVYIDLSESQRQILSSVHISTDGEPPGDCDGDRPEGGPPEGEAEGDRPEGPPPAGEEGGRGGPPGGHHGPPPEADVVGDRVQTPLEGSFEIGVIENGTRTMSDDHGDAELTAVDLATRTGEVVPESGTLTMDGPPGVLEISFLRLDEDTVQVTMDGPRGSQVIEVDPVTGAEQ